MITPERPTPGTYTPRHTSALGKGYSVFVKTLKFALPAAALVIIGILVSRLSEDPRQQLSAVPKAERTTPGQIELVAARYEGVDDENQPYTVTADKAVRDMTAPDKILFENPMADITLKDKTWIAVKSKSGFLDRTTETLSLKDDVSVFHDNGYEMHLQDIRINMKHKTAETSLPVRAQGSIGTIAAKNMTVDETGNRIIFGGPVTMTFFRLPTPKVRG